MAPFEMLIHRDTGGVKNGALPYDPVDYCLLAAGTAVAWVYAIELNLTIYLSFKRRGGLYFWSLLISSWGLTIHALAFILKFLVGANWIANSTLIIVGWIAMVTGQAFVLYSRLHLIVRNQRTLRLILYMIITNIFTLHLPTTVFLYGSNSPSGKNWVSKFNIMERIQLVGFCVQESIISTVYVWGTTKILNSIYHSMTRRVMTQLIIINCICVGMDIALICLEFTNQYIGEAAAKPMIYAIKLKLEFAVLNQLMGLTKAAMTEGGRWGGGASNDLKGRSDRAHAFNNLDAPRQTKMGSWTSKHCRSDAPPLDHSRGIFKTQHIEVTSEAGPNGENGNPTVSPPIAVAFSDQGILSKNLMGTTTVNIPHRATKASHNDAGSHRYSPSESEIEIFRSSSENNKIQE